LRNTIFRDCRWGREWVHVHADDVMAAQERWDF
jgi:hypothetical protein